VLAGHLAATAVTEDRLPLPEALWGIGVWGGAWLAGDRTRLRHQRMAELEERALRAERDAERERRLAAAEERNRIARDLHDSAGHAMNVILVHAGLGRMRGGDDSEAARDAFATIEEVARETVGEIDQMVSALREAPSDGVEPPPGLAAVDSLLERHRAAGLDISAAVRGHVRQLPPGVDQGAYRILQEALTNAARHGDGSARVVISFGDDALDLAVANPLPPEPSSSGGGHGLPGMRERAALLGGTLDAAPSGTEYRVHAHLPLRP
jgi:signal transduction histidine kinase